MDRGQLVPDKVIIELVLARLAQHDCTTQGWLLDGFPRTGSQVKALLESGVKVDFFICLEAPDATLIDRILSRRTDPVTGKIYNMKYSPPDDNDIRARLIKRSDDSEDKVKAGIQSYRENLPVIIDKVENVVKINAGRPPKQIWTDLRPKIARAVKYIVVFVLGGPGSGKGTQCSRIHQTFGYTHLSAGDLLREERAKGSALAELINDYIVQGKIVPAEITINLLAKAMSESGNKKFLIDGFPRNMENMEAWYQIMDACSIIDFVLFFDCPESVMTERLLERGKTSGRADDNINTILKRFQTFQVESMPVLRYFQRLGKVRFLSAVPPVEIVFQQVSLIFKSLSLIEPYSRTLGIIKPDAVADGHVPAILDAINALNLTVICTKYVVMTDTVVTAFYADLANQGFFRSFKEFMISGPCLVMVLEGTDAVMRWRTALGPTNSMKAKQTDPESIRARFGTNGTRNACHGSDTERSAIREISFWLDPNSIGALAEVDRVSTGQDDPVGLPLETTLGMIKPLTSNTKYDEITSILTGHGFEITAECRITLTSELTDKFYAEHVGKSFYPNLKQFMMSGQVIAFRLQRYCAIKGLRHLLGFTNSEKARLERPDSIRALYGLDGTRNAMHGSDAATSAAREVAFFFSVGGTTKSRSSVSIAPSPEPAVSPSPEPMGGSHSSFRYGEEEEEYSNLAKVAKKKKNKFAPTMSLRQYGEMAHFLESDVDPIIKGLVERVLLKRPKDVLTFAMQDLAEQQRLSVTNSSPGSNKMKLEPLNNGTQKQLNVRNENVVSQTALDDALSEIQRLTSMVETISNNIKEERRNYESIQPLASDLKSNKRQMIILHFNDIYEYEANLKESYGGAARLSWQIKNLKQDKPLVIHSGDFLSPSTTSNVTKGAHMVQIMNCIGIIIVLYC